MSTRSPIWQNQTFVTPLQTHAVIYTTKRDVPSQGNFFRMPRITVKRQQARVTRSLYIYMTAILFFLKRVFYFFIDHWKIVLPAILILIVGVWFMHACNKPPKLDEKAIQKAEQAVKERNDAVLKEILVEAEVKEKQIDANLANAETEKLKALDEARKKYNQMSTDELAKAIEERK